MNPREEISFTLFVKIAMAEIKQWGAVAGFNDERPEAVSIALMHSELSEALEAIRSGDLPSEHINGFSAVEEEYADLIIRVLHECALRDYLVAEAVIAKMKFNQTRPYRHGKLF